MARIELWQSQFPELEREIASFAERLTRIEGQPKAQRTLKKAINLLLSDAKSRVHPSGKGEPGLQANIKSYFRSTWQDPIIVQMGVSYAKTNAYHAHLVEYGHRNFSAQGEYLGSDTPPHPFWEPALNAQAENVIQALEDALNDEIDKAFN